MAACYNFELMQLLLCWTLLAAAQDPPKRRDLADLSLEELLEIRVDEVVGASRFKQKVREAPASVTVITADEIRKFGYRTLSEVLGGVRGAYVTSDRNYSYLGLRGFGLPADYNNRMLGLVDGLRLNDPTYGAVLFDEGFAMALDDLERVEVIRGPASSLYGSNAFFGVVNVMTRKGRQLQGGEVSGSVGSFGTYEGQASYGRLVPDGPEIHISGSGLASGGQDHYYPEFDDPATGNGVNRNADRKTAGHALAEVSWKGFSIQAAYAARTKEVPTGSYGTNFPSRHTRTEESQGYLSLAFKHEFPDTLSVHARAHVARYGYEGDYEYAGPYINTDEGDGARWGAELLVSRRFLDDRLNVALGTEYRDEFKQDQKNYDDLDPKVVYLDSTEDSTVAALFAQADWGLLESLRLNAGLRYDDYDTFGSTVNPRAALIFSPAEDTVLKILYGRAFRAPSAFELHYLSFGQKANPDLDPETIDTFEGVVEQRLTETLDLVASVFHYRCEDLINLVLDPNDGLLVFRNEARVNTSGVELELRAKLESGLEGRLSWSFQEAKFDEGDSWLPNSPRNLAKAALALPLGVDGVFAALEARYVGERRTLAKDTADDYLTLNLTLTAREVAKGLDLSASVYNLLDEEYADPGGIEHVQDRIEQDGLSFRIKATWRF